MKTTKHYWIFILGIIFISGCAPKELSQDITDVDQVSVQDTDVDQVSVQEVVAEEVSELRKVFEVVLEEAAEENRELSDDFIIQFNNNLDLAIRELGRENFAQARRYVKDAEALLENPPEPEIIEEEDPFALDFNPEWGDCEDKDAKFSVSPIDPKVIEFIEPMGLMHPSHPFPTKHMYISDDIGWENTGGLTTTYDVVAPADGLIVGIGASSSVNDYQITIWYSCSLVSYFIHLADPAPEILAVTGELPPGSGWDAFNKNAIPVKAGQRIARSKGTFDFGVLDSKVSLTGWIFPTHQGGGVQIHHADPFDYFVEPVRSQMLEKNPRTAEPVGGKIDYDIDGRLVGNWFEEGREGYASGTPDFTTKGHLAIAYDNINPTRVLISFGAEEEIGITHDDCRSCGWVYGVKGNKPDPADVNVDSGLVKYELLGSEGVTDSRGFRVGVNTDEVLGVFLVQMLDDRTIKGEVFPRKKASQVTGFTVNSIIYHR